MNKSTMRFLRRRMIENWLELAPNLDELKAIIRATEQAQYGQELKAYA